MDFSSEIALPIEIQKVNDSFIASIPIIVVQT